MKCTKLKYKTIGEFPEEHQMLLHKITNKEDVINTMMLFQNRSRINKQRDPDYIVNFDWTYDIEGLAKESQNLMSRLPKDIRHQYHMYRTVRQLMSQAKGLLYEGDVDGARLCWSQAQELKCCNEGECND